MVIITFDSTFRRYKILVEKDKLKPGGDLK